MSTFPYSLHFKTPESAITAAFYAENQRAGSVALPNPTPFGFTQLTLQILSVGKQMAQHVLSESLKIVPLLGMGDLFQLICKIAPKLSFVPQLTFSLHCNPILLPSQTALFILVRAALRPVIEEIYNNEWKGALTEQTVLNDLMVQACKEAAEKTAKTHEEEEYVPDSSPSQQKLKKTRHPELDLFRESDSDETTIKIEDGDITSRSSYSYGPSVPETVNEEKTSKQRIRSTSDSKYPKKKATLVERRSPKKSAPEEITSPIKLKKLPRSQTTNEIPQISFSEIEETSVRRQSDESTYADGSDSAAPSPRGDIKASKSPKPPRRKKPKLPLNLPNQKTEPVTSSVTHVEPSNAPRPPEEAAYERNLEAHELHLRAVTNLVAFGVVYLIGRVQRTPVGFITCVAIFCLQYLAERLQKAIPSTFLAKLL